METSTRKRLPRLKICPDENTAYEVLRLTLENENFSGLSARFVARTRVISRSIGELTSKHDLKPEYADFVEDIIADIFDPQVCVRIQ